MEKALLLSIERCVGCGACVVACMDQNDIFPEHGDPAFRRIYQVEEGDYPNTVIRYLSVGCNHCEDTPCIAGCPTGAISKDPETHAVIVDQDICIGCHSCALACPFGVPRYNTDDKMFKCILCNDRVKAGLKPACVRVCPFGALSFEVPNQTQGDKELGYVAGIVGALHKTV